MTTYTYTDLIDPSAASNGDTQPVAINDKGQVTGFYFNGTHNVGFLYSGGTWTNLSDPSASGANGYTVPASINERGQVTGSYFNGTANLGFLYSNGTYTTLSDPSAADGATAPSSINDKGQVVGYFYGTPSSISGFVYSNGTWTNLSGNGGAQSINDSGQVIGFSYNSIGTAGFLYKGGTYTFLSDPSSASGAFANTYPISINNSGQIIGNASNNLALSNAFLYTEGTYTSLSDPSAASGLPNVTVAVNIATSINDKGQVTGYYFNGTTYVGFLYSNGTWTDLSDPSADTIGTFPESINDQGQVTGYYYKGTTRVGFIATPTDVDNAREPPKLTITDHSLSLSAGGTIPLPIIVPANDTDDTVSVKISGVPSFDTIKAGDGHVVAKKDGTYTFTAADVQSGLTLTSSLDNHAGHEGRHGEHDEHRVAAEQSKLTVTAFNTTAGEHAASSPQTITVTNTPNDLSYLMQLLNELQPKFLELTTAHSAGGPTIEMETYGPQHVTAELPPIQVTAPNGDPTTVSFSNTFPNNAYELIKTAPPKQGFVNGPIPGSETPGLKYLPVGTADHAGQLEVTNVAVTATDTVTGKSTSTAFNFIGVGQDKTLPPDSFPFNFDNQVRIPQGEVFGHYEQLLQSGSLNPGQSFQSLAALINQYAASFHNEHEGIGQMTSSFDKQGHQENLAFLSNPQHHG